MEIVFDLDDTLYAERDYVVSALLFAGAIIRDLYSIRDAGEQLLAGFSQGQKDSIGAIWEREKLPETAKGDVIAAMRAHQPNITLRPSALALLDRLRSTGRGFSIVTDGRSVTQRAKLKALGCLDAKLISISEEVSLDKTDIRRFQEIEKFLPNKRYCYVGDNPQKDFISPNKLGWMTIMLTATKENIHPQTFNLKGNYLPKHIIHSLSELEGNF